MSKTKTDISGGVYCADFVGRDQTNHYGFSAEEVEHLIEKVLTFMQDGGVFLPAPHDPERLQIERDGEKLIFHPGAARQLAGQRNARAYLLSLTVDQEYQRWATRFVPLAGKMDIRQVIEGLPISFTELIIPTGDAGLHAQTTQRPLENIAEAMQSHGAFVILGDPGAGKTTTQQRIAFDAARNLLAHKTGKTPLFVRLSQQRDRDPYTFLETEWERRTGIAFADALREGRLLILADGINEIPPQQRNKRLLDWMVFDQQYRGVNQLIFSGRTRDYDNQLNLPRVLVEPLDEPRIKAFLTAHRAEGLADLLDDPGTHLRELARNPLNLFVLALVYLREGKNLEMLANRGRLFQAFSEHLLWHQQRWHRDDLSVETKVDLYAQLAYAMQQQGAGTTFDLDAVQRALPVEYQALGENIPINLPALLRFGRGASILDPATLPDVRFYHHLLQEYFAARELLRRFNAGEDLASHWRASRLSADMPKTQVGEWDPLPQPPTTGWEVTTLLACGLARNPAALLEAVRPHNPVLAGRCLDEAGIEPPEEPLKNTRADLLADLYNPAVHLRARLQAGVTLGRIGDPRFQPQTVNGVQVIIPEMVAVPTGTYWIGSADNDTDALDHEKPRHPVELPAFSIGRWPVTNAEFACFMEAGGYQNEKYWKGDLAKRWLRGEDVAGGQFASWLDIWETLQSMSNVREQLEQMGNFTPEQIDTYAYVAGLTEDELKTQLSTELSQKSREQPAYWYDAQYNNSSQPVVGITWFEARAYCTWLSEISGVPYRLPTEPEWESSARGTDERVYAWGDDWSPEKANSIEGRVLRPSPVGAYAAAGGVGPFKAEDQSGNVWEWTTSLYMPYPYQPEKAEDPEATSERVVRGGAWDAVRDNVRCAARRRICAHRGGAEDATFDGIRLFGRPVLAPRIHAFVCAAGRGFPFEFGGQAVWDTRNLGEPGAVRARLEPGNANDRLRGVVVLGIFPVGWLLAGFLREPF